MASALDAAHEQGLIHRDVKPANVLVATGKGVEKADHAYLTDFGLTKHRGSQSGLTEASAFIGTLDYIAPEQIEGKPVDGRTDQYGLACVAFECLAGRVPYVRDTDIAIAMAHLRDAPPSALELRPDLPADVDAVLARGMAKRPDDRYPSCEAFVVALRGALGVRPTEERRAVAAGARRTRRLAVGAAAVLLVAVVAVAVASFGLRGGAGPSPSPSPGGSAAASSAAPSAAASGAADNAFPNAEEQALLDLVAAVPGGFAATCVRGPYAVVSWQNQLGMSRAQTPRPAWSAPRTSRRQVPRRSSSGSSAPVVWSPSSRTSSPASRSVRVGIRYRSTWSRPATAPCHPPRSGPGAEAGSSATPIRTPETRSSTGATTRTLSSSGPGTRAATQRPCTRSSTSTRSSSPRDRPARSPRRQRPRPVPDRVRHRARGDGRRLPRHPQGLQRRVALKLLAPDYADDEAFRGRFLRESRLAAAIDHPNIIPIYEAGEVDGAYFLADAVRRGHRPPGASARVRRRGEWRSRSWARP